MVLLLCLLAKTWKFSASVKRTQEGRKKAFSVTAMDLSNGAQAKQEVVHLHLHFQTFGIKGCIYHHLLLQLTEIGHIQKQMCWLLLH
jgi:hypothetical protein